MGSTCVTYGTDVALVIEENVIPTLTCFGIVKIERALFGIKIVLHNLHCPFEVPNFLIAFAKLN